MSEIKHVNSAPDYINKFIHNNMEQLMKIYSEGISEHTIGILGFECSEKENIMNVQFLNETLILNILDNDSWKNLQNSIHDDKKLFFIRDKDLNSIFLIYI